MIVKYRDQLITLLKEKQLPLIVAELGVAEGLFAKTLMDCGVKVLYLIDNWAESAVEGNGFSQDWHDNNLAQVQSRMAIYDNRPEKYIILQGDTVEMADYIPDNSLSMVYIDADHSYNGVKRDIEAYYPKVINGGIVAFHDYLNTIDYGVNQAVIEFCREYNYEVILIPENQPCDAGAYFIKH